MARRAAAVPALVALLGALVVVASGVLQRPGAPVRDAPGLIRTSLGVGSPRSGPGG